MVYHFFNYICSCYKIEDDNFSTADTNNDGRITLDEFHKFYLKRYGVPPSNDQWIKFHLADVNNNGYITKFEAEIFERNISILNRN